MNEPYVQIHLVHYACHASEQPHFLLHLYSYSSSPSCLTELPGSLDVNVVVSAADADDDAQRLELLQVFSGQGDCVVHHGPHGLIQHLREEESSSSLPYYSSNH